jgi:acetylornithine deacetylase/succinyl-diaminopimelate desuccinylase-like protein
MAWESNVYYINMEEKLLKQLIEIPSYLDKKRGFSEYKLETFIKKFFIKNFKDYRITNLSVEEKRNNLLIVPKSPLVIFCCHLDTVSPSRADHTKLKIIDGDRAYGLGTKDMKGGTVSAILSTLELSKEDQRKVGFLFYCDEEREQKGMQKMLENYIKIPKSVKYLVSPESRFNLNYGCRGYAVVKVVVHGKRAHTSRSYEGVNAGEALFKLYEELKKDLEIIKTKLGKTSVTLTSMHCGVLTDGQYQIQNNAVPDYAEAIFSIRLSRNISEKELKDLFDKKIKGIHTLRSSVEIQKLRSPSSIAKQKDLKIFLWSAKQAGFDIKISDPDLSGYNDVAMISSKMKVPFFNFGPYGEGNHGPDEYVNLQSIKDTKSIFEKFIQNLK